MEIKKEEKKQRGKKRKNCLIFNLFSQLQMEKNQKAPAGIFQFHLKSSQFYVLFPPMKVPYLGTYFCLDLIVARRETPNNEIADIPKISLPIFLFSFNLTFRTTSFCKASKLQKNKLQLFTNQFFLRIFLISYHLICFSLLGWLEEKVQITECYRNSYRKVTLGFQLKVTFNLSQKVL